MNTKVHPGENLGGLEQLAVSLPEKNIGDLPGNLEHAAEVTADPSQNLNGNAGSERVLGSEGYILLYTERHEVYVYRGNSEKRVNLTPIEFKLLQYLMENPDVCSYEGISTNVWGYDKFDDGIPNVIRVNIKRLREKIEHNPNKPQYIETVHGFGYRFIAK